MARARKKKKPPKKKKVTFPRERKKKERTKKGKKGKGKREKTKKTSERKREKTETAHKGRDSVQKTNGAKKIQADTGRAVLQYYLFCVDNISDYRGVFLHGKGRNFTPKKPCRLHLTHPDIILENQISLRISYSGIYPIIG